MDILKEIEKYAREVPDRTAIRCLRNKLTYGELWSYSDILAAWLMENESAGKHPVAVYGHKNPWMIVCFLACVKSGHAYCPVDVSVPRARVEMILQTLPSGIVLTTEPMPANAGEKRVITLSEIKNIACESDRSPLSAPDSFRVKGSENWYIIFTSGSTGAPKGVQISADCLNHYLDWSAGLGGSPEEKRGKVFLNQAPFSFDLSVMDLYTCLASGGTLYCLEKSTQSDYRLLLEALRESRAAIWVSTPSFAEVCLSDPSFTEEHMKELRLFLFCGETLGNRTVQKLQKRFPDAVIVNTYGPTESTVAVTEVTVTPEMAASVNPLPVGMPKPGTKIEIRDEKDRVLPEGERGEIIIIGNTVSTGYYQQEELTRKAFFIHNGILPESDVNGNCNRAESDVRGYHTGDKGYVKNGMLFYCGRLDLQIKLHGYRIELEDIENNIRRLPGIEHAAVLPNIRDGKVKSLTAFIVKNEMPSDEKAEIKQLKESLLRYVPEYMVPKKFVFLKQMPVTDNGKADRKRLRGTDR